MEVEIQFGLIPFNASTKSFLPSLLSLISLLLRSNQSLKEEDRRKIKATEKSL
ncbi:uncharacterized protein DS421_2g53360 [Arachis hypogaea]|nr:uncharacterized protein DS421_2g53360 [Arachis hypogaea]